MKSSPFPLPSNKLTEIDFSVNFFGKCKPIIIRQEEFDVECENTEILCEMRDLVAQCKKGEISAMYASIDFNLLREQMYELSSNIALEVDALSNELEKLYQAEKAVRKDTTPITARTSNQTNEHRMRCNVCGHIFCYTDADVKKNKSNSNMAALNAVGSLASVFGGTIFHTQHLQGQANHYADKIVDYSRCPSCHSNNITEIKEGEVSQKTPTAPVQTVSAADELKKLKELLDMDIITQEEFDAKKKQLLGL
ncbi:MAG: SHOCT domain-containing protein [Clostridia bacterium]|nr:SHOCT domain-containing protein [Clostridia bacterium]